MEEERAAAEPPFSNPTAECDENSLGDRLAILQELYQRKHAELVAQLQQSQTMATQDYLQSLQLLQNIQPNILNPLVTTAGNILPTNNVSAAAALHHHPYLGNLRQTSSEQSTDEPFEGMQVQPGGLKSDSGPISSARNRRTFSGSGQTISQTTRDRLKTMIACKKQKQRLHSTGSTGSASNVSSGGNPATWIPPSAGTNSEINLMHHKSSTVSNHFEPYPHPSPLRKVNSEPNLKMRIRARLLNKGSSPVTATQHPTVSGQSLNHNNLQRCDSEASQPAVSMEMLMKSATAGMMGQLQQTPSASQLPFPANIMIPSPSLPNLLMQASFASFLSMPSLLKTNPLFQPGSMLDPLIDSSSMIGGSNALLNSTSATSTTTSNNKPSVKFDTRSFNNGPLPIGGYPSLLKQQLRDLVLRRKSLVREEPESEEVGGDAHRQISFGQGSQNNQLKTGLAYDAAMSKHQCLCGENHNHVEHGGRVQSIWSRLIEAGLVNMCERVAVRKAPLELLRLAHSPTYVTFFAVSPTACLKLDPSELPLKSFVQLPCGGIGVDSDTYFNDASTQLAIRVAVGLLVELSSSVVEGKLRNGFACIRPPGHHAEREQAMGFCFFNNVSITVRHLQQRFSGMCNRIAIVDWDVHHGNGTQLCFESDPNVLYVSVHRHDNGNFFPGTGAVTEVGTGEGKGFTVNIPFSGDIMGDAEYLAAWRVLVVPLLDSFKPDFIIVSAGFDAARGHPAALGGYEVSPQLFGFLTRSLLSYAGGKVVLALEGGYDLPSICESAEECVKALCAEGGEIGRLSPEELEKVPNQSAQETIQKVIAVHKKHWPSLTGVQGINTSELHWQTISKRFSTLTVHS
ncbi:histone deacetylase domain-containing protein [Ditylenchus destructor]|nr:histone deacetylase domain-containing protein [Ditylenchus destructor]